MRQDQEAAAQDGRNSAQKELLSIANPILMTWRKGYDEEWSIMMGIERKLRED